MNSCVSCNRLSVLPSKMKYSVVECNVEVNDVITPMSCSAMVIEFIKYIIYHKQLIPYPYERLKLYVDKRRKQLENAKTTEIESGVRNRGNSSCSLVSDKYFKKTEEAQNSLENIFKLITEELTSSSHDRVEEVVILLGTSFVNPQDIFRLCIPSLNYSHSVKHHSTKRNCRNLFSTMFKSEQLHNLISNTSCTSSLHVMFKMKPDETVHSRLFIPRASFKLPTKGNHAVINFTSENWSPNCSCRDFEIFEDSDITLNDPSPSTVQSCEETPASSEPSSSASCCWYQIRDTLRHFSDVHINGTAVTDLWMNPPSQSEHHS